MFWVVLKLKGVSAYRHLLQLLGKLKKKKIEYLFPVGFSRSPTPSHGVAAVGSAMIVPPSLE